MEGSTEAGAEGSLSVEILGQSTGSLNAVQEKGTESGEEPGGVGGAGLFRVWRIVLNVPRRKFHTGK